MKLTICGSFGFGNAGDEAIPEAIFDIAASLGMFVETNAVGRFPEPAFQNIVGIGDNDRQRLERLRGQPVLVSGGGIIENSYHAVLLRCSQIVDKAFSPNACLFGISVESGVDYGWRCRRKLLKNLRRFEMVYTRDVISEATIKQMWPNIKTETIGDVVLWLQADPGTVPKSLRLPEKYIAVNLSPRWTEDKEWRAWVAFELRELCKELGSALVLVPMTASFDDDRRELRKVAADLEQVAPELETNVVESFLPPRAIASIFRNAGLVVSMRLHGCVIAYGQNTPCVGIAYHPKIAGFFNTVQLPGCMLPSVVPASQTIGTYGYRFSDLQIYPGQLVHKALASLAQKDFSMLSPLRDRSAAVLREFLSNAFEDPR
jgi:polysaccharide pyruvyl transferase WcaK-like protein